MSQQKPVEPEKDLITFRFYFFAHQFFSQIQQKSYFEGCWNFL